MNPKNAENKGPCDVYGNFYASSAGKSDGWHSDIEEIIANFESESASTCENTRK